jgi:hypothetical protein
MKWLLSVASMVVMFLTASLPAGAAVFTGEFSGAAEVPPNDSEGTGTAEVELDEVQHILRVDVTFSGLMSPTSIAHIHCCAPVGENANVATAVPTFPGFPAGVMSGTYEMTFDTTMESTFNAAFIAANGGTPAGAEAALLEGLNNGMAYFNIHTNMFGGGEIRADLVSGEPTTPTATEGTPGEGTATPTPTVTLPAGTASATITLTPGATATVTGEVTASPTASVTTSPAGASPTATASAPAGSPTSTSGTPVSTATASPPVGATGSPVRTATPTPIGGGTIDDDGCAIVTPQRSGIGNGWFLLMPAGLLVVARRRRW